MSSLWEVQSVLNKVKNVVLNYTEMEAKVREATSNETWGASGTLMQEISLGTHNYQYFNEIMTTIHRRFTEKEARHWRQIYKALTLLEYLVKNGAERVVDDARSHLSTIKYLKNFAYIDEKGKDQGANVRNRAKELVDLLSDTDRIKEERRKAKANKNKYTGVSSEMGSSAYAGGGNRYGGFGSDCYSGSGGGSGGYTDSASPTRNRYDDYAVSSPVSATSNRQPSFSDEKSTALRPKIQMAATGSAYASSNANKNLFEFDEPSSSSNKSGDDWAGFSSASGAGGDDFGDFQAVPTAVSGSNGQMDMFSSFPPPQQQQQQQQLPQHQTNFTAQQPAFGAFANFGNSAPFGGASSGQVGGNVNNVDLFGSPPKSAQGFPAQPSYQINSSGSASNDAWAAFAKPAAAPPSDNAGAAPAASGFSTAAAAGKSDIWSKNINLVSLDSLGQRIADKDKTGPSLNALSTPTSQSGPGFGGMGMNNMGGMGMGHMGAQPPLSAGHMGTMGMPSTMGMGNIGQAQRPGMQQPMMMNGGQWAQQGPVHGQSQQAQGQMSFF